MNRYRIPQTDLEVSRIGYGCMGLGGSWDDNPPTEQDKSAAVKLVGKAFAEGINLFDHADIYARGKSESVFAQVWQQIPGLREQIVLQTKCGIRFPGDPEPTSPGRYDFSRDHIVNSVAGSLRRLGTDYIDILLLHRPDPLVEPDEVARAFDTLHRSGKVRYFGVSNHTAGQIELLRSSVEQPLVVNQLELSLLHADLIDAGIMANQRGHGATGAAGTIDYCRREGILIQAWSPVARGAMLQLPADAAGVAGNVRAAATAVAALAEARETTCEAIALAWLLRHPTPIQPIIGTCQSTRIAASCLADTITLTREEWYRLFVAARGAPVP
jgi:predicted oxidoreductase